MATKLQAIASNVVTSAVNNGRRQPLQGFDTTIYIQDQATGNLVPFGEFTGFQHTIRNATEPYLPLGHRNISLLDGEFQIGWVAEQGKINLEATTHALGFEFIGPILRFGRSPRFQIVVEFNAPELDESGGVPGYGKYDIISDTVNHGNQTASGSYKRSAVGRYVFGFCKIDAITSGVMAGRSVIADRIEGLAETWYYQRLDQGSAKFNKAMLKTSDSYQNGTKDINNYLTDYVNTKPNLTATGNPAPSWALGSNASVNTVTAAPTTPLNP